MNVFHHQCQIFIIVIMIQQRAMYDKMQSYCLFGLFLVLWFFSDISSFSLGAKYKSICIGFIIIKNTNKIQKAIVNFAKSKF